MAETALVTGASGGIGYQLAREFARHGYDLVLVSRNRQELQQAAEEISREFGVRARVLVKDLSVASAPEEVFEELQAEGVTIDVLVNNAGFGTYGLFWETELKTELQELQVNVMALTHLTRLFLPGMLERRRGKILNVASTAAFQPGPLMAVYFAGKAYVLHFSEAVANELEGTGVSMTVLCPGPTRTRFHERAGMKGIGADMRRMDPAIVARAGYRGLMAGKAIVIPGLLNRLLALGPRFAPRGFVTKMAKRFQERASS